MYSNKTLNNNNKYKVNNHMQMSYYNKQKRKKIDYSK